jgi:predicted nucleic acid-binding protein
MTGNNCLLDSNIIIDLLNNDARIATNLDKVPVVYVPVIVEGELLHGALHSANHQTSVKVQVVSD